MNNMILDIVPNSYRNEYKDIYMKNKLVIVNEFGYKEMEKIKRKACSQIAFFNTPYRVQTELYKGYFCIVSV